MEGQMATNKLHEEFRGLREKFLGAKRSDLALGKIVSTTVSNIEQDTALFEEFLRLVGSRFQEFWQAIPDFNNELLAEKTMPQLIRIEGAAAEMFRYHGFHFLAEIFHVLYQAHCGTYMVENLPSPEAMSTDPRLKQVPKPVYKCVARTRTLKAASRG
jgi:hypothetical protein